MFRWFAESAGVAQAENSAAGIDAEGSTVQTSIGESDVARFAVTSIAVEAVTTTTVPEVVATTSVSTSLLSASPLHKLNWFPSLVLSWKGGPGVHQQDYLQLMTSWKSYHVKWCDNFLLL